MDALNTSPMICHLCGHQVTITTCTVDENGKAVHEECYNRELAARMDGSINLPRKNENVKASLWATGVPTLRLIFGYTF